MTKVMAFLVTVMFVLPSDGSTQAVPTPGDRRMEIPVSAIETLEISLGRQRRVGKYIAIAMSGGALVGATIVGIALDPCSGSGFCVGPNSRGESIALGFAAGALIGLPVGFILGSVVREERWNPASLPAPGASGLTIRPVIGSRVGFAGSVRVGGL